VFGTKQMLNKYVKDDGWMDRWTDENIFVVKLEYIQETSALLEIKVKLNNTFLYEFFFY
jgi:hypothetical protein